MPAVMWLQCLFSSLFKYKIADVGFCNDAANEQKKTIRDRVNSSKIIYKVFENLRMEDIKKLPLEKKKVNKETQENKKELKTFETIKPTK